MLFLHTISISTSQHLVNTDKTLFSFISIISISQYKPVKFIMAPIRRANSRVQAIARISDPFVQLILDRYFEMENKRLQFLKIFGPVIEGCSYN
jgi:hypothetical protein